MSLDPVLARMMAQTIYVQRLVGVSSHGDPQFGDFEEVKARVEPKRSMFGDASGESIASDWAVYTQAAITTDDRVWLPGTDRTNPDESRSPKQVYQGIDEDGSTTHYEVMV